MKHLMILLPCALLFTLMVPGASAKYNRCPCKYHSATAQGEGTCSRSEDKYHCTIEFSATKLEEYQDFVKYLRHIGLNADPREALAFATEEPPEKWDISFVKESLPVLFAISQRFWFEDKISITKDLIQNNASFIIESVQLKPTEERKYRSIKISGFNMIIGYGCIELRKGHFTTMVKTPWSKPGCYCDSTKPPWSK